jgi:hypothetical protein
MDQFENVGQVQEFHSKKQRLENEMYSYFKTKGVDM